MIHSWYLLCTSYFYLRTLLERAKPTKVGIGTYHTVVCADRRSLLQDEANTNVTKGDAIDETKTETETENDEIADVDEFDSDEPSSQPSSMPSTRPSSQPSGHPSGQPSSQPSSGPSAEGIQSQPSGQPPSQPSSQPSGHASLQPSNQPSSQPSYGDEDEEDAAEAEFGKTEEGTEAIAEEESESTAEVVIQISDELGPETDPPPTTAEEYMLEEVEALEGEIDVLDARGGDDAEARIEDLRDIAEELIADTFPEGSTWECYVARYDDLTEEVVGSTEEEAVAHRIQFGEVVGRDCSCEAEVEAIEKEIEEWDGLMEGADEQESEVAAEEKNKLVEAAEALIVSTFPEGCTWRCYMDRYEELDEEVEYTEEAAIAYWVDVGLEDGRNCTCVDDMGAEADKDGKPEDADGGNQTFAGDVVEKEEGETEIIDDDEDVDEERRRWRRD